ncbi:MAG: Holliday junction branch migration protein RuvA [Acidobacteria bacterium]|nr:Holliday junction branch migration protein RuvA [Acidobacteriota bacterium]
MIGRLEGQLYQLRPGEVILEAGGVGYHVLTTLRAFEDLCGHERATLWIHTLVRPDAITLYGFLEPGELAAFQRLITIAGVGPRTALAVLSGLTPAQLAEVVTSGDSARLQRVPGVGRKTADRIVLELEGKLEVSTSEEVSDPRGDAVSALVNLGYNARDAGRAVDRAAREGELELGELLKNALRVLSS